MNVREAAFTACPADLAEEKVDDGKCDERWKKMEIVPGAGGVLPAASL